MSGRGTKGILAAIFLVGLAGCETVYKAATEERPLSVLVDDEVITTKIKKGFKRVETYFLPGQPAPLQDFQISAKIKAKIIGDGALRVSQVDMAVVAGHAVLTGVVDRPEKIEQIMRHARAVEGVVAVKSFLQLKGR